MKKTLNHVFFIIKLAFQEAPAYTLTQLFFPVWSAVVVYIEHTYMIGFIINSIQDGRPFWHVAMFVGLVFVAASIGTNICVGYVTRRLTIPSLERINRRLRLSLYEKAAGLDLASYDDPKFYNDFVWAMHGAADRVPKVLQSVGQFNGTLAGLAVAMGYVLALDPAGVLFAGLSVAIVFAAESKAAKRRFTLEEALRPLQRKRDYTGRVFYLAEYAKELRVESAKGKLLSSFQSASEEMEQITKEKAKGLVWLRFVTDYVADGLLNDCLYILYLLYRTVVHGAFRYGSMVVLYNSVNSIRYRIRGLVQTIPDLTEHGLNIEKIRNFLQSEPAISSGESDVPAGPQAICFENVSFSYGEGAEKVLDGVNMTIAPGEKIAIVGYNGAGKSTLVKLLMRLYEPTEGRILYGGADIKTYDVSQYRAAIGTVFQDFQIFAATVGENITMDDMPLDKEKAGALAFDVGFSGKLSSLAKGYDTMLTREFNDDGASLSGGEAQKLAICRALYGDSAIVILDEPSSALDPIAEYTLNNTTLKMCRDKTVVLISHRLSTTKSSDKIYMFKKGRIIEQGTHDELAGQGGQYAALYALQAKKYRR